MDREGTSESSEECTKDTHDQNIENANEYKRISYLYHIRLCLILFAMQSLYRFLWYLWTLKFRKTVIQALGLCILLMAYILMASSAAITSKDVIGNPKGDNLSGHLNISCDLISPFHSKQNCSIGVIDIANSTLMGRNSSSSLSIENTGITIAGVLGIIALSSIDISYDVSTSLAKGVIVECVSPRQKTQILNTASMMCGIGSCIMPCVGMLDLPHYLGKQFNTDGMALTLILLCSCLSVVSVLLVGTSTRAALRLSSKSNAAKFDDRNTKDPVLLTHKTTDGNDVSLGKPDIDISYKEPHSISEYSDPDKPTETKHLDTITNNKCKRLCSVYPRNRRFNLRVFSAFLGFGAIITGILFFSHTLTIEVYKGDPTATPGTPARDLYEQGIKMASVGFLISDAVFIPTSIANRKLLKLVDHHLLLVLGSAMLSVSTLLYFLLKNVATFFVLMGAFGFHRCMGNVIPYSNALRYAYPGSKLNLRIENPSDETEATAGRFTGLVSAMIPLNLLFMTFMGPAMDSFGNGWLPMLCIVSLSTVNGVVNAIIKVL